MVSRSWENARSPVEEVPLICLLFAVLRGGARSAWDSRFCSGLSV